MQIYPVFLYCCRGSVFNTETRTTENLCIQLPGCWLVSSNNNNSFQCENSKIVIVVKVCVYVYMMPIVLYL